MEEALGGGSRRSFESPRTERATENREVVPMASTVQTNKSPLLRVVPKPIPGPLMWRTGMTNIMSEKTRTMM